MIFYIYNVVFWWFFMKIDFVGFCRKLFIKVNYLKELIKNWIQFFLWNIVFFIERGRSQSFQIFYIGCLYYFVLSFIIKYKNLEKNCCVVFEILGKQQLQEQVIQMYIFQLIFDGKEVFYFGILVMSVGMYL